MIPDLTGLPHEFRAEQPRSRRRLRIVTVALGICLCANAAVQGALGLCLFWGFVLSAELVSAVALRNQVLLRLDESGLRIRRGFRLRSVAWEEITSITVQGRWENHSSTRLADGTDLPLPGLKPEHARQLAAALAAARTSFGPSREREPSDPL